VKSRIGPIVVCTVFTGPLVEKRGSGAVGTKVRVAVYHSERQSVESTDL
jgi:hypothetical protein